MGDRVLRRDMEDATDKGDAHDHLVALGGCADGLAGRCRAQVVDAKVERGEGVPSCTVVITTRPQSVSRSAVMTPLHDPGSRVADQLLVIVETHDTAASADLIEVACRRRQCGMLANAETTRARSGRKRAGSRSLSGPLWSTRWTFMALCAQPVDESTGGDSGRAQMMGENIRLQARTGTSSRRGGPIR